MCACTFHNHNYTGHNSYFTLIFNANKLNSFNYYFYFLFKMITLDIKGLDIKDITELCKYILWYYNDQSIIIIAMY